MDDNGLDEMDLRERATNKIAESYRMLENEMVEKENMITNLDKVLNHLKLDKKLSDGELQEKFDMSLADYKKMDDHIQYRIENEPAHCFYDPADPIVKIANGCRDNHKIITKQYHDMRDIVFNIGNHLYNRINNAHHSIEEFKPIHEKLISIN